MLRSVEKSLVVLPTDGDANIGSDVVNNRSFPTLIRCYRRTTLQDLIEFQP